MFMVKDEYRNTKNLLKVKIKTTSKNFKWFFIYAAIMFLGNLVPTIISILQNNDLGVVPYNIQDYSMSFFFGLVIAYLITMVIYRMSNDYWSVLPQTNNSRFISSQLLNCIIAVVAGLTVLVMYLLDYGVLKLISHFKDNIYFAFTFDVGFIITGFFTYLVYSFLVISAFGLVGAILRKWKYYAVIIFIAILSLMFMNMMWVIENLSKVFAFLIKEPIPAWFMIKGITLWLAITAVSLVINYYTVYYKSQKKIAAVGIAVICGIVIIIILIVPIILFRANTNTGNVIQHTTQALPVEQYYAEHKEIRIDVSHFPKGSKLNIEGENLFFPELTDSYEVKKYSFAINGTEAINSLQGDTLIIHYRFPMYEVNDLELSGYSNPKLNVYLDGNTLHIDYTFENAHVISLPIWGIAGQFDCYKDKELLPKTPWGYSSGGGGSGNINIEVE